jgi:hypothetical protein
MLIGNETHFYLCSLNLPATEIIPNRSLTRSLGSKSLYTYNNLGRDKNMKKLTLFTRYTTENKRLKVYKKVVVFFSEAFQGV